MSLAIFDPNLTDRARRLYEAVQPFVQTDTNILDIGCGEAPLCKYFTRDFPKIDYFGFDSWDRPITKAKHKYPLFTFKQVKFAINIDHIILKKYDVIIHVGVDCHRSSDLWKIHSKILENSLISPIYVLLEAGYNKGYVLPHESYLRIIKVYVRHGYKEKKSGRFDFDIKDHKLKDRRWIVLGR